MKLIDYIRGNRHGKDANRVERDAMTDAFLQEALDGYDSVISNHLNSIARLEEKVQARSKGNKSKKLIIYWSAAASLALIITIGSIYFVRSTNEPLLATRTETKTGIDSTKNTISIQDTSTTVIATEIPPVPEIAEINEERIEEKTTTLSVEKKKQEAEKARSMKEIAAMREDNSRAMAMESASEVASEPAKKFSPAPSVTTSKESEATNTNFGKKEFKKFFYGKAKKGVCGGKKASVEVEFTVNGSGYPSSFRLPEFSCDEAKSEVIRILSYSPKWTTNIGEKVKLKLEWK